MSEPLFPVFKTPFRFLLFILGYFVGQFVIRVLLGGAANLDEAEQLFLGQELKLGYGPQPPLYTWLQIALFAVAGTNILALALLKNVLLFCSYSLTFLNARLISGKHAIGVAAALSLCFIPQIAWESQRDLTHSVLAATLSLATLFTFLKACSTGNSFWFAGLGVAMGCGLIAKYNYALWAVGLIGAACLLPEFRTRMATPKLLISLALASAIAFPHFAWALEHRDLAMASSHKFSVIETGSWFLIRVEGLANIALKVFYFLALFAGVYAFLLFRRAKKKAVESSVQNVGCVSARGTTSPICLQQAPALIIRALGIIISILVIGVFIFGFTRFKDRWFQPILICVPAAAACAYATRLDSAGLKWLQRIAVAVMVTVTILIPARVLSVEQTGRTERSNYPFSGLARQIAPQIEPGTSLLVDTELLGGNLRITFPENRVQVANSNAPSASNWILIWDAREDLKPPVQTQSWAVRDGGPVGYFESSFRYHPERTFRIGVIRSR